MGKLFHKNILSGEKEAYYRNNNIFVSFHQSGLSICLYPINIITASAFFAATQMTPAGMVSRWTKPVGSVK